MKNTETIKKLGTLALFLMLANGLFSQQTSLFNTYAIDPLQLNIAYAGANCTEANLHYRAQWIGMKETPKVIQLNAHTALGKSNGLGIRVNSQNMGLLNNLGVTAGYSYRFGVSRDAKVHLGIGVGWSQAAINAQRANVIDVNDVTLSNNNRQTANGFDSEFGAMYLGKKLKGGLSALHLYNTNPDFTGSGSFKVLPQLNSQISYVFYKDSKIELEPWLLNRFTIKGDNVIEGIFKVNFLKSFTAGLGYRSSYGLLAVFSAKLSHLTFAYSVDYGVNKNAVNLGTSHQLMVGFSFCKTPKAPLPEETVQSSEQPTVAPIVAQEPVEAPPVVKEEPKPEPVVVKEETKPEPVVKEEPKPVVKEDPKPEPVVKEQPKEERVVKEEPKADVVESVSIANLNEIAKKVIFDKGSYSLSAENESRLRTIAKLINEGSGNVTVVGFASPDGDKDFNSDLANNRARTAKAALIHYGVKANRIAFKNGGISRDLHEALEGNRTIRFE